jgi:hypothetical protein
MAQQDALSIFLNSTATKDKLAEIYAEVQGTIATTALSLQLKNTNIVGDVRAGSVKVFRMKTAEDDDYGTARAAHEGRKVQNNGVIVKIDTNKEIVEEFEKYDLDRYGLPTLLSQRSASHAIRMAVSLDKKYFEVLQQTATIVSVSGSSTADKVLDLIRTLEAVENENVEKVDRALMVLTLAPEWYDSLRQYIHTLPNPNGGGVSIEQFHGVQVLMAPRQGYDAIVQVRGSIAQPVSVTPYAPVNIELSNAVAVKMFYDYGTYAVMPDLVYACALDAGISA